MSGRKNTIEAWLLWFSLELNSYVKHIFCGLKVIYPLYCNRVRTGTIEGKLLKMMCAGSAECFGWTELCETWQLSGLSTLLSVVHNNSSYPALFCQQMMTTYFSVCTQDIWLLLGEIFQFTPAWEQSFVIHLICHNLLLCIRHVHLCVCVSALIYV